jgi:hypothetical protein
VARDEVLFVRRTRFARRCFAQTERYERLMEDGRQHFFDMALITFRSKRQ